MKRNSYILITGLMVGNFLGQAQSIPYTKYGNVPLEVNPALVASPATYEVVYAYRGLRLDNESAIYTSSLTFLAPVHIHRQPFGGAGGSIVYDQLDHTGTFSLLKVQGGFGYHLDLAKNQAMYMGLGLHYGQYHFSLEGLTTGAQYLANVGFSPDLANGESQRSQREGYFSFSPGLLWVLSAPAGSTTVRAGMAVMNANEPQVRFTPEGNVIARAYHAHGGVTFDLTERTGLDANLLYARSVEKGRLNGSLAFTYRLAPAATTTKMVVETVGISLNYLTGHIFSPGIFFTGGTVSGGLNYDLPVGPQALPGEALEAFVHIRLGKRKSTGPARTLSNYSVKQIREFYQAPAESEVVQTREQERFQPLSGEEVASKYRFKLSENFKFGFNEAGLDDEARLFLDNLAGLLDQNKKLHLEVIGHSDDVGPEEGNLKISRMRAEAIAGYLVSIGIARRRIHTAAKGASEPLVPNVSEQNRAKNRRVEFLIFE